MIEVLDGGTTANMRQSNSTSTERDDRPTTRVLIIWTLGGLGANGWRTSRTYANNNKYLNNDVDDNASQLTVVPAMAMP
jgi:hypothetical protein